MAGAPFWGRLLFCTQNLLELETSEKSLAPVFGRGSSGLENRRLERKIRPNSISNFRLCAAEKLDIVIYPVNPLEISVFACFSSAKSAQVHNPMADFAGKCHPSYHDHQHSPGQKIGGYFSPDK